MPWQMTYLTISREEGLEGASPDEAEAEVESEAGEASDLEEGEESE